MATSLNRRQVERWLKQGLSLRAIAARLDIPWTTFRRHWQALQQEASTPVQADVREMAPRPGPPPVDTSPRHAWGQVYPSPHRWTP
jgi:predicted ArsR family transcriptional regulator